MLVLTDVSAGQKGDFTWSVVGDVYFHFQVN